MADTDHLVHTTQGPLQYFVNVDRGTVREPEQGVVGETHPESHGEGMEKGFVAQGAGGLVTVDNLHPLSEKYTAEYRVSWQTALVG